MVDLPIEDKLDLKESLDKLIKTKQDAIEVLIYLTLRWKVKDFELAREVKRLQLRGRDKIVIIGKDS